MCFDHRFTCFYLNFFKTKNTHFLKPKMSYGVFVTTYTLAEGTLLPRTETLFALGAIVITKTHGSPISNNTCVF